MFSTRIIHSDFLINQLPTGVVVHSRSTEIIYANPKALEILRLSYNQAIGKDSFDPEWKLIDSKGSTLAIDDYPVNKVIRTGSVLENEVVGIVDSSEKTTTWVLVNAYPDSIDITEDADQFIVTFVDITSQKKRVPFEKIVAEASDAIVITRAFPLRNEGPEIVYVNKAFSDITGYTAEEAIGRTPRILQGKKTDSGIKAKIYQALLNQESLRVELINYSKNGEEYWIDITLVPLRDEFGQVNYFAAIERDITEQKKLESQLSEQACTDPLTGLLNRRSLYPLASKMIADANMSKGSITVVMLDIDHFKNINDIHGHDVGDRVICCLSELLNQSFRKEDVIARYGGEEFVLVLSGILEEKAYKLLNKLRVQVSEQLLQVGDDFVQFTISIGVAFLSQEQDRIESLLAMADEKLYKAKRSGRNKVL